MARRLVSKIAEERSYRKEIQRPRTLLIDEVGCEKLDGEQVKVGQIQFD